MHAADSLDLLLGEHGPFDDVDLAVLRRRSSYKWSAYAPDVLPAFVAEMDFPLCPAVAEALAEAVAIGDCGYAREDTVAGLFAAFAQRRWGWDVDPGRAILAPDVMAGVARSIEILTAPGDAVIYHPPVYPPFRRTIRRLGRRPAPVPMVHDGGGWRLDLDGIARALDDGARAVLLCHPHNPTGTLAGAADLAALATLAARSGAGVISDEVHAPLTLPGRTFTPFLALGEQRALTVTSASKAWNVPGLKCAIVVAGDRRTASALTELPPELRHPGHLGVVAATAAFSAFLDGDQWLDRLISHLQRQHERTARLLETALPAIGLAATDAGYLRWLDCRALGLGAEPAAEFLARGRVALSPGTDFGSEGAGFVRLNVGTSGPLLAEAVRRMARAVAAARTAPAPPSP